MRNPARPSPQKRCNRARVGTPFPREDYANIFISIRGIAGSLQALNHQAARQYAPLVEAIVRSGSRDVRHIEHTLDGLLDFCGHEPVLQLYKKLCRHYLLINPAATADYIRAYRERWDSEAEADRPSVRK